MDWYKRLLAHAKWTWREEYFLRGGDNHRGPMRRRKDREMGRRDKRSARAFARREIQMEAS